MTEPLLDFVDEPHVPAYKDRTVRAYIKSLIVADVRPFKPDPEFLDYLRVAHGRLLRNCWFTDANGYKQPIHRVFSYATKSHLKGPLQDSWRNPGDDIRLDYSVPGLAGNMPNYQFDDVQVIPFAGVGTEGMAEFDMLCLDYEFRPRPAVVLREHEENAWEDSRTLQFIAKDFSTFKQEVFRHLAIEECD